MMHVKKTNYRRTAAFVICSGCIAVASLVIIYKYKSAPIDPVVTASVERAAANIGVLLLPDGQGGCIKYRFLNDTGKASFEGAAPCDTTQAKAGGGGGGGGGGLPPVLRGMQDSLRAR